MRQIMVTLMLATLVIFTVNVDVFAQGDSTVVSLKITGMTTPTCPVLLTSAVEKIDGVKSVSASLEHNSATIEFDESQITLEKIRKIIQNQVGFDSELY